MPILIAALLIATSASVVHAGPTVALIGDDYHGVVLRRISARESSEITRRGDTYELALHRIGLTLASLAPGGSVTTLASLLNASEIALIVVDSTRGPTAAIREHILIARQARVPMLAILLANVEGLYAGAPDDAAELLALEIQEIRALLSAYELNGDAVSVFYDARTPDPGAGVTAVGTREMLRVLSKFAPRRAGAGDMQSISEIWAAVYLLTPAEADGHAVSLSPNDAVTVWSEGTQSNATLASLSEYHPGDFREMPLVMDAPLSGREGSRILLVRDDRVVGVGAITQIGR